jgi:hypothetical protein
MHELAVLNIEGAGQQNLLFCAHLLYDAFDKPDPLMDDWKLRAISYRHPVTGEIYSVQHLGWIHE